MFRRAVIAGWLILLPAIANASVTVLTYHDVVDRPGADKFAVTVQQFEQQMAYLAKNGYQPISLQNFYTSRKANRRLPPKSVILTFDDGLRSYEQKVVPILNKYRFPSVLSVVSAWADGGSEPEEYRGNLLGWDALRKLSRLPLVEVVSHSHDLHHWILSSPQGTTAPSAVTRRYLADKKRYETEAEFEKRILDDLNQAQSRFRTRLGKPAIALTWPYGQYDAVTWRLAGVAGFKLQLTLEEGAATTEEFPKIRRYMLLREHTQKEFEAMLGRVDALERELRFVELDLDLFSHVSVSNHPILIEQMISRLGSLGVNAIVVTPFSRDGKTAFFPNNQLPVAFDLLNGVLDRVQSRLGIEEVYLRFPAGKENYPEHFFSQLARRSRFNAALFDVPPDNKRMKLIRTALQKYLPDIKLGSWKNYGNGMELSFVTQAQFRPKDLGTRTVFVLVSGEEFLTTGGLAESLTSLRNQGVRNYGYGPLNYLAGARAPDALIEAMAYRLRKVP